MIGSIRYCYTSYMKNPLSIITACLLALSISACSNVLNKGADNLTAKPLELATQAYLLMDDDADSNTLVTYDLERAYRDNGTTQAVINHLLKKQIKPETPDAKDDDLEGLARRALDEKNPDFKKALTFARGIKKPATKSKVLLRIAEELPKNNRLQVLRDAEKNIALSKETKFVYGKRSKLLKLAKMYFESGDKQSARKTILSSHALLIRNTSSSNAIDFGTVAELESQLGIQPSTLCKLTRFLHKTKDRPIALARITSAYLNHGHQGQVCMPDEELIITVRSMPDAGGRVPVQLVLAEAWHARKEKNKSNKLYNDAIKSVNTINSPRSYKFDMQTKVLISLKKMANEKLYNSVSKDYWEQLNKQPPNEQSSALMQLVMESYDVEGLPDLSLDALSKMKENSLKATTGVQLARIAHKKNDQIVAEQALSDALLAAKTTPHPVSKMDWLREVIDTAHELGNIKIGAQALKVAEKAVAEVSYPELKVMYAIQITTKAWKHKDYRLAQVLNKKSQLWYEQYPNRLKPKKSNEIDYYQETKNNILIDLLENNVRLGNNSKVIVLLNRLPSKKSQAKALVYAAIALAEKRKQQGVMKTDKSMLNAIEKNIQRIRKND